MNDAFYVLADEFISNIFCAETHLYCDAKRENNIEAVSRCGEGGTMMLEDDENARNSILRRINKYVERGPFALNPDAVVVRNLVSALVKNKLKYGYAYCPCRKVNGIPEVDKKNICPCQSHKEDIAKYGACECGLFVKKTLNPKPKQTVT